MSRPRARVGVVVALVLACTVAAPTHAQARSVGVGASLGKGTVDAYATSATRPGTKKKSAAKKKSATKAGAQKSGAARKSATRRGPAGPALQYVLVPDCGSNSPALVSDDCAAAPTACPEGTRGFRVFEAPIGTATGSDAGWSRTASRCLEPEHARAGQVVVPQLGAHELRRLPVPPPAAVLQPPNGTAAVRLPVNVYAATTGPTTLRTSMLGLQLLIELEPVAYDVDFGDGTVHEPTTEPGGPYPSAGAHLHTYARPGTYPVILVTTFEARFSVNGGAWQPIAGQTTVRSPAAQVHVLSGGARLQDEPTGTG